MSYKNKSDATTYMKQWRKENAATERPKANSRESRRRKSLRQFVISLKNKPCADCEVSYPYYVMDFDHLGEKKVLLAKVHSQGWSEERILEEVSKCDLVCSNCHRERTHKRKHRTVTQLAEVVASNPIQ